MVYFSVNRGGYSMIKRKRQLLCAIGAFTMVGMMTLNAAAPQGGSAGDPLVTKSYVDEKVSEVIDLVSTVIEQGQNENTNPNTDNNSNAGSSSMTYQAIGPIEAGQVIYGGEGTEIILRGGSAKAVCPGENGLSNLTNGTDIANEKEIPLNNLVVIPRRDGRGIRIESTAYIMVRGEIIYE